MTQTDSKWTEDERSKANDINRELFNNIVMEFPHLTDFDHMKTLAIDLQCKVTALREALEEIDRLAEAGLCQMSPGAKHAYLSDIRSVVFMLGLQGGLTTHGS